MRPFAALTGFLLLLLLASETAGAQTPSDEPFSPASRWRDLVVGTAQPPTTTADSPLIAMVDVRPDLGHPVFAGGNVTTSVPGPAPSPLGTGGAAVIAGRADGFAGVWPGARVLNVPLPAEQIRCSDSARAIDRAVEAGADVIYMGYGSHSRCEAEEGALLRAVEREVILVASAAIDPPGGPTTYPADLPHVLTVTAVGVDLLPPVFAVESPAVDVSAPGVQVRTAVSGPTDADGDGFGLLSGTMMPAAMTAAAAAWVRAARPDLDPGQVAAAIRAGARDIAAPGHDPATGHGLLSVEGALAAPVPEKDAHEPDDDIRLVNGRFFAAPAPALRSARKPAVEGTIHPVEDPADVHRLRLPAGARVKLRLEARAGDRTSTCSSVAPGASRRSAANSPARAVVPVAATA